MHPTFDVRYDRRALVIAYVHAEAREYDGVGGYLPEEDQYNEALRTYHRQVLEGLERLFGIRLGERAPFGVQQASFMSLFWSTVRSYLAVQTPWSGYLEEGLLVLHLRAAGGDLFARVDQQSRRIEGLRKEMREAHLDLLDALVRHLLGERADLTFTSEDLRNVGVDDRRRPQL